jgi:NADH-quinone oxidoreductase subunit D
VDGDTVVGSRRAFRTPPRDREGAELSTYGHGIYLAERICGICTIAHTCCYAQAVEELMGLEVPPRAKYIRTIMSELERLHSHSLWVGLVAHEAGFDTLFMYAWRDREVILNLFQELTGGRVLHAINTLGGVRRDISPEMADKVRRALEHFEGRTKEYLRIVRTEPTFLRRTRDVGVLKPADATRLNAVGPTLRASGIKGDVRRDDPYVAYDEMPFNVITSDSCDVFGRTEVRRRR